MSPALPIPSWVGATHGTPEASWKKQKEVFNSVFDTVMDDDLEAIVTVIWSGDYYLWNTCEKLILRMKTHET